jgi:DNA processing protein
MILTDVDELAAWLRLLATPGLGRGTVRQLLSVFGTPQGVFEATSSQRRAVLDAATAAALEAEPPRFAALLATTRAWLESAPARGWVALGDPRYPQALLQTADPPLLLYTHGRSELLNTPSLAIVGSRNPTPQGAENARAFAEHLGRGGLTIVSGMALGIDGAAHAGALSAAVPTIAVVGTGLDTVYPRTHRELAHRIVERGLIVSEFELGTPPLAQNFPSRNRIIAGLSLGTLVVEAALESGSLITARQALEAGRDVFAIPGSIHSPQSRGCHALIKQGAKLVDAASDIFEELGAPESTSDSSVSKAAPERPSDPLLEALGHDPTSLDALVARTGWAPEVLNAKLLELELEGRVARLPGQLFQRRSQV